MRCTDYSIFTLLRLDDLEARTELVEQTVGVVVRKQTAARCTLDTEVWSVMWQCGK